MIVAGGEEIPGTVAEEGEDDGGEEDDVHVRWRDWNGIVVEDRELLNPYWEVKALKNLASLLGTHRSLAPCPS